jgi:hypothetical protein
MCKDKAQGLLLPFTNSEVNFVYLLFNVLTVGKAGATESNNQPHKI